MEKSQIQTSNKLNSGYGFSYAHQLFKNLGTAYSRLGKGQLLVLLCLFLLFFFYFFRNLVHAGE